MSNETGVKKATASRLALPDPRQDATEATVLRCSEKRWGQKHRASNSSLATCDCRSSGGGDGPCQTDPPAARPGAEELQQLLGELDAALADAPGLLFSFVLRQPSAAPDASRSGSPKTKPTERQRVPASSRFARGSIFFR